MIATIRQVAERAMSRVRAWRPTGRQFAMGVPVAAVTIVFLVLFARNADTVDFPDYEVPEGYVPEPPPTTATPGAALPVLPAVGGTTTTVVPVNAGTSALSGVVLGPAGPVPGATVRIERSILGQLQRLDLLTGPDGAWAAPGIGGGRYRVRAFLPPTLAQRTASVFFLTAGEQRAVDLTLESFAEPDVGVAVAPDPPLLDQQLNLAIQVVARSVDADGIVRATPVVGAVVEVAVSGGWQRLATTTATTSTSTSSTSSSSTSTTVFGTTTTSTTAPPEPELVTDESGQVIVRYVCRSVGAAQLSVSVLTTPDATPIVVGVTAPACIDPTATTTTEPPTTPSPPTSAN